MLYNPSRTLQQLDMLYLHWLCTGASKLCHISAEVAVPWSLDLLSKLSPSRITTIDLKKKDQRWFELSWFVDDTCPLHSSVWSHWKTLHQLVFTFFLLLPLLPLLLPLLLLKTPPSDRLHPLDLLADLHPSTIHSDRGSNAAQIGLTHSAHIRVTLSLS